MVTLTEILEVNWIILYSIYGQVFFVTGLVAGLLWHRRSHLELARPLPWLAAFGIAHGLNEWGYIFVPLQALYLEDAVVRILVIAHLLLLGLSFYFLLQFGVELLLPPWSRHRKLRMLPPVLFVLWAMAVVLRGVLAQDSLGVLVAIGDAWSRYLLCLPGAVLASIGLYRQARQMRDLDLDQIAIYLTGAAIAFLVYAVVSGILVPSAPVFPAIYVNYALLDETIRIPAPVFRSLCGLAIAYFVARSLDVFKVEMDERIAAMESARILAVDRERIGRELHDGIIQKIYASGLGLEEAHHLVLEDTSRARSQIRAVMQGLDVTIQDIRRYIFDLRTAEQTRELEVILENLVRDLRVDTMLEVDLEVKGQRCCWLDAQKVAHVTQIAREALSNVVQHACASNVIVSLKYEEAVTCLSITDDGKGIDQRSLSKGSHVGQGIINMQERARMLGGELTINHEKGRGTRLLLKIPCGTPGSAELKLLR